MSHAASLAINLRQNPGGRRYLLIPAFISDQAGQDIGADVLFLIGQSAIGSPILDRGQAMLK
jgi:hypothetical protein